MENKALSTGLTILAFAIGIMGLILGIMIMSGNESVVGTAITLSMIVMGVAAGIAVLFGAYFLFSNIKKNVPFLIGIVVFVILAFVCYSMASSSVLTSYGEDITSSTSQLSGAGIMVMYVLIIIAVAAALIGEVVRIFK